jgi:hypothetical protein
MYLAEENEETKVMMKKNHYCVSLQLKEEAMEKIKKKTAQNERQARVVVA